jgi:hypothetical protein
MSGPISSARGGEFATARRGGLDSHDMEFIAGMARKGVPDSAVAKMLMRGVQEVTAAREALSLERAPRRTYGQPKAPERAPVIRRPPPPKRGDKAMPARAYKIIREVCDLYAITWSEMVGERRHKLYTKPRQQVWWRLWTSGFSLPQIAHWFNRHHTSILAGANAHSARLEQEREAA